MSAIRLKQRQEAQTHLQSLPLLTNAPVPLSAHTDGFPSVWLPERSKPTHLVHRQVSLACWCKLEMGICQAAVPLKGGCGRQKWRERLSRVRVWGRHPVTPLVKREKWPTGQGTHRPWTGGNSLAGRSEIRGLGTGMGRGGGV